MKAEITLTIRFRPPTDEELAMDMPTAELPRFVNQSDAFYFLWTDSGIVDWLRHLAAELPDNVHCYGPYLLDRYPPPYTGPESDNVRLEPLAQFRHRLGRLRLKRLFFGEPPAPWFALDRVTITRRANSLVCQYR